MTPTKNGYLETDGYSALVSSKHPRKPSGLVFSFITAVSLFVGLDRLEKAPENEKRETDRSASPISLA